MPGRWVPALLCTVILAVPPVTAPAAGSSAGASGGCGLEAVTAGSPFHGIHGLTVTGDGQILAGSVVGRTIYEIAPDTGTVAVFEPPPFGMADDLDIGPTGTLAWTAPNDGKLYLKEPGGAVRTAAEGLPGLNSVAWTRDGRLFVTNMADTVASGLDQPEGLALAPGGDLVVAEVGRQRAVRVDLWTGRHRVLRAGLPIGFEGLPQAPRIYIPAGVAVALNGDIYISSDIDVAVYRLRHCLT